MNALLLTVQVLLEQELVLESTLAWKATARRVILGQANEC